MDSTLNSRAGSLVENSYYVRGSNMDGHELNSADTFKHKDSFNVQEFEQGLNNLISLVNTNY